MDSPEQDKDDFYNQLHEVIAGTQHKDKLILMGDFKSTQASVLQKAFDRRAFYNGIKKVFGPQENGVSPVSSSDGTLLTDKGDILKRWKEHFDTVLNTFCN